MSSVKSLVLAVRAYVAQEERRVENFKNKEQIKLAKLFLEKVDDQNKPFCRAKTVSELKQLFQDEIEILEKQSFYSDGEQLSFFPTPDTNIHARRIERSIQRNIDVYQQFLLVCDYEALVAPRFSIVEQEATINGKRYIKILTVDNLGKKEPRYWGKGENSFSLTCRAARGYAEDYLKLAYSKWQNPQTFPDEL